MFFACRVCVWAHPRVGGENVGLKRVCHDSTGSSPRGRGKLSVSMADTSRLGLIPAWAGKTTKCDAVHTLTRAHPRVGGENPSRRS